MSILFLLIFAVLFLILKRNSANIKGAVGEAKVNATLHALSADYILLHDVLIRNAKGTTSQIDQIVLSEYGIFVIETKHYKDSLFFNSEESFNFRTVKNAILQRSEKAHLISEFSQKTRS